MRFDSANSTIQSTVAYDVTQLRALIQRLRSPLRLAVIHGGDKTQPGAVIYPTHNPRSHENLSHRRQRYCRGPQGSGV